MLKIVLLKGLKGQIHPEMAGLGSIIGGACTDSLQSRWPTLLLRRGILCPAAASAGLALAACRHEVLGLMAQVLFGNLDSVFAASLAMSLAAWWGP